jgi:hypothetical protein
MRATVLVASILSSPLCALSTAAAQQPAGQGGGEDGRERGGLRAQMTAFKTEVPARAIDMVLVQPTRESMGVSVTCYLEAEGRPHEGYVEFRREDASPLSRTTVQPLPAGKAVLITLTGLNPNTAYVYRVKYRPLGAKGEFAATEYFSFHTPRARTGEQTKPDAGSFTFTIQADSHLDQGVEPKMYEQTLSNMLAARPDFMIDLGDTFMTDKRGRDFVQALPHYDAQRYYFSRVAHSVPLFMVLGNHDGEKGTSGTSPVDIGPWSYAQRTSRFPPPIIDGTGNGMYTGATAMKDGIGANYFAFEWGDAIFIALDPYWSTTDRIRGGGGGNRGAGGGGGDRGGGGQGGPGAQRPGDDPLKPTDSSWTSTLGRAQYEWLTTTLEKTSAKYRFVFIHHLVGGMGGAESRGGVESSPYFEWGGKNADGTPGFTEHRRGWTMPIHDLLVKHKVSAIFHGHDHLYVNSQRDGVVYQCVPQPGNPRGSTRSAAGYGYTSGTLHGSPGHVRVRVGPDIATVEFVRSSLAATADGERENERGNERRRGGGGGEANGTIVHSYAIKPVEARPNVNQEHRP